MYNIYKQILSKLYYRKLLTIMALSFVVFSCSALSANRQKSLAEHAFRGLLDGAQIGFTPGFGQFAAFIYAISGLRELADEKHSTDIVHNASVITGTVVSAAGHIVLVKKAYQQAGVFGGATAVVAPQVAVAVLKAVLFSERPEHAA